MKVIPVIVGALSTVSINWILEEELKPFRPQHYKNHPGYLEKSWIHQETYHSDSREKPAQSKMKIIMMMIIIIIIVHIFKDAMSISV